MLSDRIINSPLNLVAFLTEKAILEIHEHEFSKCLGEPEREINMEPFDANNITIDNWQLMMQVRKKPVIVHATQLNFPEGFTVTTKEGVMKGKPHDYLMIGVNGEKYPIDKEIFEKTYDIIGYIGSTSEEDKK